METNLSYPHTMYENEERKKNHDRKRLRCAMEISCIVVKQNDEKKVLPL